MLGKDVLRVVIHRRQRQRVGLHRQDHDGRIGRIDFTDGRLARQIFGQLPLRRVDSFQHVGARRVDVPAEVKLQRDGAGAKHVHRRHLRQTIDLAELGFQRLGDGRRHRVGAGAGILGGNRERGKVHLRQGRDREQGKRDQADQEDRRHQQRSADGAANERGRNAHERATCSPSPTVTRDPGWSRRAPSVTRVSSPLRPLVTTAICGVW